MTNQLHILAEVGGAMLLGGLIGLERELADKPAGLRTHMLVAATAALLLGLSDALVHAFNAAAKTTLNSDPIRIVQAIVMGIGFPGAGTIIQRSSAERVEGLTTGASLLLAAALGICVAARQFILAVGATLLALIVLILLGRLEKWLATRRRWREESEPAQGAGTKTRERQDD
jgi:putative Mg2+ transporter-C (MgtC) family protein